MKGKRRKRMSTTAEPISTCHCCGGLLPARDEDLDAYDAFLVRGGECPGSVRMDYAGRVVGCGAWSVRAYPRITP